MPVYQHLSLLSFSNLFFKAGLMVHMNRCSYNKAANTVNMMIELKMWVKPVPTF